MRKNSKIIAILPAYNAEKTLERVLSNLPKVVFSDIIVSDDCSVDKTYDLAGRIRNIIRIRTPRNLGYGGNLKYLVSAALSKGADVVVEIHPDGEYKTNGIIPALDQVQRGADLVLGNRFSGRIIGMYWWKNMGTRLLTAVDNLALNSRIPDLHQGFRVYTRKLLTTVPWREANNDYLFSFQIIAQAIFCRLHIASVPVSTYYSGTKRGARTGASIRYALGTFRVICQYFFAKMGRHIALFSKNNDKEIPKCPKCRNTYLVHTIQSKNNQLMYLCDGCNTPFFRP